MQIIKCFSTETERNNLNVSPTIDSNVDSIFPLNVKPVTEQDEYVLPLDTDLEAEYRTEINDIHARQQLKKDMRQFLVGRVVSDKAAKSIVVQVIRRTYFPKYNRFLTRQRKVMAHDEEEICNIGDYVRIVPCQPKSAKKRHRLFEIIKKAGII